MHGSGRPGLIHAMYGWKGGKSSFRRIAKAERCLPYIYEIYLYLWRNEKISHQGLVTPRSL
jgi:hypothetical protein